MPKKPASAKRPGMTDAEIKELKDRVRLSGSYTDKKSQRIAELEEELQLTYNKLDLAINQRNKAIFWAEDFRDGMVTDEEEDIFDNFVDARSTQDAQDNTKKCISLARDMRDRNEK